MVRIIPILLAICLVCSSVYVSADATETYDASRVSPATKGAIQNFLNNDSTDESEYNLLWYSCLDFAVDLWRNAYLAGLDAFIVIVNKGILLSHAIVGFHTVGDSEYVLVDPQKNGLLASNDGLRELADCEVITIFYGENALKLWQEVSGKTSNREMTLHRYKAIWLYNIMNLLS